MTDSEILEIAKNDIESAQKIIGSMPIDLWINVAEVRGVLTELNRIKERLAEIIEEQKVANYLYPQREERVKVNE